jgi:hypothetical protein
MGEEALGRKSSRQTVQKGIPVTEVACTMHSSLTNPVHEEAFSPVNCGAPREEDAFNSPTGTIAAFECGRPVRFAPKRMD